MTPVPDHEAIAARIPGLRRFGTVVASHDNAQRAFDAGAPVLVYPGGDVETFRPSWHSDQVEFDLRIGLDGPGGSGTVAVKGTKITRSPRDNATSG